MNFTVTFCQRNQRFANNRDNSDSTNDLDAEDEIGNFAIVITTDHNDDNLFFFQIINFDKNSLTSLWKQVSPISSIYNYAIIKMLL